MSVDDDDDERIGAYVYEFIFRCQVPGYGLSLTTIPRVNGRNEEFRVYMHHLILL